jgi:AbrB family looped-hinge helix DNA binding protein
MKITTRGQVTVPRYIRERLGLLPRTDVEWELRDGTAVLRKASGGRALIEQMRGRGTVRMTTDEVMALTRGDV